MIVVNISPTGREGSKAGIMQHLRQHPGELPPFAGQQQDLQVYVFGNTGVATYVEELTAKPDQHLPWSKLQTDGTDVFVKDSGTWKLRLQGEVRILSNKARPDLSRARP